MKTIQIAPNAADCTIKNGIITGALGERVFHYALPYTSDKKARNAWALFDNDPETVKAAFCAAIALASKPWQVTDALNRYFDVEGGKFYED